MIENETKSLPENAYQPLKAGEVYKPIVPAEANEPELTARSIAWGVALCVIFTVASAYSGLKVGQVMEAAIPISIDRKSTRLNSSHLGVSYAVFCLKKKKIR